MIEVDTNTLPNGATLTTDNVEEADFASYGNTDNDNNFGLTNLSTLSVIKTSDAPSNMVAAGDTITYTIQIQNLSATTQTGVTVSDPLPTNTMYVAQSTIASLPTLTTVASDDFESADYSGGTGWLGNWTEVNESNGVGSNDVRVQSNQSSSRLKVQDSDKGVFRLVDLSVLTTGTLTFDFRRRNLDAGQSIGIYASGTASTTCDTNPTSLGWVLIGTLEGPAHDGSYTNTSFSLPASVFTADAGLCFLTPDNTQANEDKFFFDNVDLDHGVGHL